MCYNRGGYFLFQKARIIVIDTQAVQVINILEVVNNAGDEIDMLNIKLSMNNEFLVALVISKYDSEKHKNLCYYLIWDRHDYSKKPYETKLFQFRKNIPDSIISKNLLNILLISEDGNLLIDETRKYTTKPEIICVRLNLKTKSQMIKVVTIQDFIPPAHIYRQNNAIVSEQLQFPKKDPRDIVFFPYKTIIFQIKERLLWQNNFDRTARIIGWSENYIAVAASLPGTVTVYRLIDGKEVLKFETGFDKEFQRGDSVHEHWNYIHQRNSETMVQFSRNGIACKGMVLGNRVKHPPFDIYILDFATGKVILECNQDLGLPDVKKFLFLEDLLVLEQRNKIVLAKFWLKISTWFTIFNEPFLICFLHVISVLPSIMRLLKLYKYESQKYVSNFKDFPLHLINSIDIFRYTNKSVGAIVSLTSFYNNIW